VILAGPVIDEEEPDIEVDELELVLMDELELMLAFMLELMLLLMLEFELELDDIAVGTAARLADPPPMVE
jgi:hypothetical protein